MKRVMLCSKFSTGNKTENTHLTLSLVREIMKDGVIAFAPHMYFPQFLDDANHKERQMGINMGIEMMSAFDELWIVDYTDQSEGMKVEIDFWVKYVQKPIRFFTFSNGSLQDGGHLERGADM